MPWEDDEVVEVDLHLHGGRELFIDNRLHSIIEIILVDRPCAMGV
jgi:hypothetical protein